MGLGLGGKGEIEHEGKDTIRVRAMICVGVKAGANVRVENGHHRRRFGSQELRKSWGYDANLFVSFKDKVRVRVWTRVRDRDRLGVRDWFWVMVTVRVKGMVSVRVSVRFRFRFRVRFRFRLG